MEQDLQASLICRDIIAFGTGTTGIPVIAYLNDQPKYQLIGVSSSRTRDTDTWVYGNICLPLYSIQEWYERKPNATILVTTDKKYHAEITDMCRKAGFKDILPISEQFSCTVISEILKEYLVEKGVSFDADSIFFKNMSLINPFQIELMNRGAYCREIGEIILSNLYPDWPYIGEGPYDYEKVQLLPNDIVLDCGAHMGVFSVYAVSKGCRSYAFEPTPELQPFLRRQNELNGDCMELVEAAVSDNTGSAVFHVLDMHNSGSTLLDHDVGNARNVTVSLTTVDQFVEEHRLPRVDFIKADIEGAERLLLSGAQRTLATFAPKLALCTYHLPDDKDVLTELILSANPRYKILYTKKKLHAYVP